MPANLENSAVATGLEKVSFHSNPKRQCQRMYKLLYSWGVPGSSAGRESACNAGDPGLEDMLGSIPGLGRSAGSLKMQEGSRKTSISALLTIPKLLTVWITINCGKF